MDKYSNTFVNNPVIGIVNGYPRKPLAPLDIIGQACDLPSLFQTEVNPSPSGVLPPQEGVVIYQQNILSSGVLNDLMIGNPLQPSQGYFLRIRTFYCASTHSILYMYQGSFPLSGVKADALNSNGNGIPILDNMSSNWGGVNASGPGLVVNPGRKLVPVLQSSAVVTLYSVMIVGYHLQDCASNWALPI